MKLARRGATALTITVPSRGKDAPAGVSSEELVRWQGRTVAADVVAVRRALDLLAEDERVDAERLGLVGWSLGGRLGALAAGVDDHVRAIVLVSAGAAPVSEYVDAAPAELRDVVREALEPIDPLPLPGQFRFNHLQPPFDNPGIRRAFLLCYSRVPSAYETEMAASFFARAWELAGGDEDQRRQPLAACCQAFLATAEFRNLD